MDSDRLASTTSAIVTVGEGRGFLTTTLDRLVLIVTAAHSLPRAPKASASSDAEERTYPRLVGALDGKPTLWAECVFYDSIGDLAVLGRPDERTQPEPAAAFKTFIANRRPLKVGHIRDSYYGWILALDGRWSHVQLKPPPFVLGSTPLKVHAPHGYVNILDAPAEAIAPAVAGSPILTDDGAAIGIVNPGPGNQHPLLVPALPLWLMIQLGI